MTMPANKYLKAILASQRLADDSQEMKDLRARRDQVEKLLRAEFASAKPTIRYGGSIKKGTLIKASYDLDIVCYFPSGETACGDTLTAIYDNVRDVLAKKYGVREKTSAIRLVSSADGSVGQDYHIDIVPGRFTDDAKEDCFLHQRGGDKDRLKTNLDAHIEHVRESGVLDALGLLKLLRVEKRLPVKQFAWELLGIKLLEGEQDLALEDELALVLQQIAAAEEPIVIEDPANPTGNDLSGLLAEPVWSTLRHSAKAVLDIVDRDGWEEVFGPLPESEQSDRVARLTRAIKSSPTPVQPWSDIEAE